MGGKGNGEDLESGGCCFCWKVVGGGNVWCLRNNGKTHIIYR